MSSLTTRTLGEICDEVNGIIRTGPFGSQLHQSDYAVEGLPVIMPKDIIDGKIDIHNIARIGAADELRLQEHKMIIGDIVYARRGDIGRRALIHERENGWLCGTGSLRISLGNKVIDPRFLYYYLGESQVIAWIQKQAVGATMSNLNMMIVRSIPITYPSLPTQRKIAAILSAYDDLIENNTRRIHILEEMAQAIYREWFVHFRFPGHEGVRMVESRLGLIPEGWEVLPIGKAVETLGGSTPSTKSPEFWEKGDIIWYTPSDLTANRAMFISDSAKRITSEGLRNSSARIFPSYSVMMTSRATIGVTSINTKQACTNQGFISCIPNEHLSVYQLYFWIHENLEKIINVASGATYKEINRTEFREFLIVIADKDTNSKFVEIISPIGKEIENLLAKNDNLRQTRDLLLPKLARGEVEICHLQI